MPEEKNTNVPVRMRVVPITHFGKLRENFRVFVIPHRARLFAARSSSRFDETRTITSGEWSDVGVQNLISPHHERSIRMIHFSWKEILRWLILMSSLPTEGYHIWHERMGLSTDEIASQHGLSLADVNASLAYYYDHRQAIDEVILTDESL